MYEEKQNQQRDPGAVWKKTNDFGEYLSISIEIDGKKYNLQAFPVKEKRSDKSPDYRIKQVRLAQERS